MFILDHFGWMRVTRMEARGKKERVRKRERECVCMCVCWDVCVCAFCVCADVRERVQEEGKVSVFAWPFISMHLAPSAL